MYQEKEEMEKWRFRLRNVQKGNVPTCKRHRMYIKHSSGLTLTFLVKQEVKKTVRTWQAIKTNHIQILITFRYIVFSSNVSALHSHLT